MLGRRREFGRKGREEKRGVKKHARGREGKARGRRRDAVREKTGRGKGVYRERNFWKERV
jgi:hypothetical protein